MKVNIRNSKSKHAKKTGFRTRQKTKAGARPTSASASATAASRRRAMVSRGVRPRERSLIPVLCDGLR